MEEKTDAMILSAYKREEECSAEERRERILEKAKCLTSFWYFLDYVKIVDPPTASNPGGVILLKQWPHIIDMVKTFLSSTLIVIMKSRQIGASWIVAAYVLWFAISHKGSSIILFSKGEKESWELLSKCRRIWGQLPDFLQPALKPDSSEEMGFPDLLSSIKALAATETAGISFTASIVVCDEWEEHPYADGNYLSSKPTRDAGGQFIGIFTVNKLKPDTLSKAIFKGALEGINGYVAKFYPYWVRPGRDEAWYADTRRSIPERELATLTPDLYMEQNYPRSIEEALRTTQDVSAFDHKALDDMMSRTHNPVEVVKDGIDSLIVNIYKDYLIGDFFIAASDTAHGVGKDNSVTTVMNVVTGEIVADILNNRLSPEEFAMHSVRMLQIYQSPKWYIESNDLGGITISTAQRLHYSHLGYQDPKMNKIGFNTNGWASAGGLKGTRTDLFAHLIPAINNRQITIYNSAGLKQFYDIIRVVEKAGRIEAVKGRHDDYPIAVGICWLKKGEVSVTPMGNKPVESLTFANKILTSGRSRWMKLLEA
uniref:Putative terminase n=1 Tax=viral metagenome TaxID=1070528 RepID=A0A6M3IWY9_9ZZZZ